MSTQVLRGEEKIAVVLMGLAPAATESVLAQLGPHSGRLRAEISRLNALPPPQEVVEQVLHEFKDMLVTTAENATRWKPRIAPGTSPVPDQVGSPPWSKNTSRPPEAAADAGAAASRQPGSTAGVPDAATEPMDDPVAELRAIGADRLAAALTGEHPSTAALVLNCLESEKAGEVLKRLPAEPRRNAFMWLRHGSAGTTELVPRVVRAIVQKSQSISGNTADPTGDAKYKKMAEMLRSLERTDRIEVLAALEQQDSETATRVKDLLYQFEDLLLIEDRSMQKLLAEIDSKTLALALKDAPQEISEKVMGNLSKRARESLTEEVSFLGVVPAAELQRAQKAVVEVIQRLDQAGELVMKQ